jgi:hypothetical protein
VIAVELESIRRATHPNLRTMDLISRPPMQRFSFLTTRLRDIVGSFKPHHTDVTTVAADISKQMRRLLQCQSLSSPVFRKQVLRRLRDVAQRLERLAEGRLVFESTETWRTVYEEVLKGCQTRRYLSVALIRSDDYWRDAPGQSSLDLNFELIAHSFHVHRIFIIDEFFWPPAARTPSTELFHWIQGQRLRGVDVSLVRLSELEAEPALVGDFGLYGTDAVGWQQTDFEGRTVRYEISFDPMTVAEAQERWHQLLLFAKSFDEIIVVE